MVPIPHSTQNRLLLRHHLGIVSIFASRYHFSLHAARFIVSLLPPMVFVVVVVLFGRSAFCVGDETREREHEREGERERGVEKSDQRLAALSRRPSKAIKDGEKPPTITFFIIPVCIEIRNSRGVARLPLLNNKIFHKQLDFSYFYLQLYK